jgi:uncharacterized membrane protein YedE/YeeE
VKTFFAFLAGLVFGIGLLLGGMTQPSNVIGFLDVTGSWNPLLAFVMGGAVITYFMMFRSTLRRGRPWFDTELHLPTRYDVDGKLVGGAALFGIGWGLAGYCPGPGIVSAATGSTTALVFVATMIVGMLATNAIERR